MRHSRYSRWGMVAALAAGAAAVVGWLVAQLPLAYWFDEANTLMYVEQPMSRMLTFVANDFSPPGYYFLLKGWVGLFGSSELATGSLSLVLTGLAALLLFLLACRFYDRWVAAAATALFIVSNTFLYFATETRMYALLMVLGLGSTLLLHRLSSARRGWLSYLAYGAVVTLGVWTHYSFWFLFMGHNVAAALLDRDQPDRLLGQRWVAIQLAVTLGYWPQWLVLSDRVRHWFLAAEGSWANQISFGPDMWWQLPLELFARPVHTLSAGLPIVFGAVFAAFIALQFVSVRWKASVAELTLTWRRPARGLLLILPSVVVPLVVVIGLGVPVMRYVSYLTPLLCLLIAGGLPQGPQSWRPWVWGMVVVAVFVVNWHSVEKVPYHYQSVHWPAVAHYLDLAPRQLQTVIAANFEDAVVLSRYYHGPLPVVRLMPVAVTPGADRIVEEIRGIGRLRFTSDNVDRVAPLLQGQRTVWWVRGESAGYYDPGRQVDHFLQMHCVPGRAVPIPSPQQSPWGMVIREYTSCVFDHPRMPTTLPN